MRVVVDGLPISGSSLAIVVEHLLEGWSQLPEADDIHLLLGPGAAFSPPAYVTVHRLAFGRLSALSRVRAQSFAVPRLCRSLGADIMLGVLPTTSVTPLPCPRVVLTYDLRHELRPEQFSRRSRAVRAVSYGLGFRQADGVVCISERTRQDVLRSRAWLRDRPVRVSLLGANHVDAWPTGETARDTALAFGQYGNKNVQLVLEAWRRLEARGEAMPLIVVGLSVSAGATTQAKVDAMGLSDVVTVLPWLSPAEFQARFSSAGLVVFPSDFEGFGLPAVEAMRLGIPIVVTPEPALLEVTGGLATVMNGWDADALADAVVRARHATPAALDAAREHASAFTWKRTATSVREALVDVIDKAGRC